MSDNPGQAVAVLEAGGGKVPAPSATGARGATEDKSALVAEQERRIQELTLQVAQGENRISCIQEIGVALASTISLDDLLNVIMEKITVLMDADRSTLFLIDGDSMWSKIIQGDQIKEIRLQVGEGIAGWVAQTGKSVNIRDAYRDQRFNSEVDLRSGYQTRSILCQPIRNQNREIIGVIQVLNSSNGYFTVEDENLLSAIASQAAISIENSKLYLSVVSKNLELVEIKEKIEKKISEVDRLYEIQAQLTTAINLPDLIRSAASKILEVINAEFCAVTIKEKGHMRLFVVREAPHAGTTDAWSERAEQTQEIFLPGFEAEDDPTFLITSLSGEEGKLSAMVIESGSAYSADAEEGACLTSVPRKFIGRAVRNVVAVPLFAGEQAIGTMELINKIGTVVATTESLLSDELEMKYPTFEADDLKLISLMAGQISRAVATTLFRERQEKANRLSSIGQMLSGVIHDFKTPVTIISGYVQLMSSQNDEKVRKEYAQSVLKQFDQLNRMTKEVLAFARGESSILLRKIFVHKLIDDLRELLTRDLGERGIKVTLANTYGGAAMMDEVKIKRAITNLARNAAEAMPEGGEFTVETSSVEGEVVFRVTDTGPGIPPEIRDSLFESFVTRGKEQGTGLGLAIVKKICEDHKGSIDYVTETERGTTFTLRIPITQPEE